MKILVFQHVDHEQAGYIGEYAKERGHEMTVLELWKSCTFPDMTQFDALIVLGGPMSVYESFPSKEDEMRTIREQSERMPILGICLGSQLIAHALGARIYPNEKEGTRIKEIGYYTIGLTEEGKKNPLFNGFSSPITALEWHGDAFDLPEGATLLATSPACTNQAFSYKRAYGTLFHFEFTEPMVQRQVKIDSGWAHKDFELDDEKLLHDAAALAPRMKEQCYRLLDNFLSTTGR